MGDLRTQNQCHDHRFDRRSFRTFGRKFKLGLPSSSPPPPPQTFAQIGNKKTASQKLEVPQTPLPPTTFVESEKPKKQNPLSTNSPSPVKPSVSPAKKARPPPDHSSTIKRGSTVWVAVSATQNPDGFVSQQLTPNHESQLI